MKTLDTAKIIREIRAEAERPHTRHGSTVLREIALDLELCVTGETIPASHVRMYARRVEAGAFVDVAIEDAILAAGA